MNVLSRIGILLLSALAYPASQTRASIFVAAHVEEGSASPDGRFAAIRVNQHGDFEYDPAASMLLLVDIERGTRRPITHPIYVSVTSPDGARVAFATTWGVFVAPQGSPTTGTLLMKDPGMRGHLRGVTDLVWLDSSTIRVLSGTLIDIDATTGSRRVHPRVSSAFDLTRLGPDKLPTATRGEFAPEHPREDPHVLDTARLLGWSADGRLILQRRAGEPYWLVDPTAPGGDVRIVSEHPGALLDSRLELRRRSICGSARLSEIWLHDGRCGHRPRFVLPVAGFVTDPDEPRAEPMAKQDCADTWSTDLRFRVDGGE